MDVNLYIEMHELINVDPDIYSMLLYWPSTGVCSNTTAD